ncbi:hypothetical protein [Colwellia sp. Arc7-D]|uniref:hypothetical protein n=1 Tax=Colwellia sp. Arc7-D TaxID=2161872 RepID=UPI0013A58A52|nr:hypothetical protein [Colwellia sp. Arc7-D]
MKKSIALFLLLWSFSSFGAVLMQFDSSQKSGDIKQNVIVNQHGVRMELGLGTYYLYLAKVDKLYIVMGQAERYREINQTMISSLSYEMKSVKTMIQRFSNSPEFAQHLTKEDRKKMDKALADLNQANKKFDAVNQQFTQQKKLNENIKVKPTSALKRVAGKRCKVHHAFIDATPILTLCLSDQKALGIPVEFIQNYNKFRQRMLSMSGVKAKLLHDKSELALLMTSPDKKSVYNQKLVDIKNVSTSSTFFTVPNNYIKF